MKILVVDDENIALRGMVRMLTKVFPDAQIQSFQDPGTTLMLADDDTDIAFLDVEMPEMNGIQLGEKLLEKNRNLNIIYCTAYSDYALDAYQIHASGYLTKPVSEKMLYKELEFLRYPVKLSDVGKLQVKCFGNFEVFYKGTPIHFSRSGSKAVLAYLVDRKGSSVTIDELCVNFWEDSVDIDKKKSYIRTMIKALRATLEENQMKDVLVSRRNSYAINPSLLDCDYYKYLDDPKANASLFKGEYMSQYSWAERTLGNLSDSMW